MRIITFGSSHAVGYGLSDVKDKHYDTASKFAFSNIVAEHFDCENVNLAKCGNSIEQIHADIMSTDFEKDDIIILQVSTNPNWFKLITPDNQSYNVMNPDCLDFKGGKYKRALHELLSTLTGDNHWRRTWHIHFYSIMHLLANKKVVWFFDRYMPEYFDFEKELSTMPVDISNQLKSIRKLCPTASSTFVGQVYAKYLNRNCPESVQDNGHYNEIGHKFWAENVLIPHIKEQLTR